VLTWLRKRARISVVALSEWHPWVLAIVLGCIISGFRGLTNPPDQRLAIDKHEVGGVADLLSHGSYRPLQDLRPATLHVARG